MRKREREREERRETMRQKDCDKRGRRKSQSQYFENV